MIKMSSSIAYGTHVAIKGDKDIYTLWSVTTRVFKVTQPYLVSLLKDNSVFGVIAEGQQRTPVIVSQ
jgi:hypothetical protein